MDNLACAARHVLLATMTLPAAATTLRTSCSLDLALYGMVSERLPSVMTMLLPSALTLADHVPAGAGRVRRGSG